MKEINFHHLRYFHEVARAGHLGRTAERLNVSQSALSIQIKALEERIGQKLFDRVGRGLQLTEAGRIALGYTEQIFGLGAELSATLSGLIETAPTLRVGALSTLSRNFQIGFLRPLLSDPAACVTLRSGSTDVLLEALRTLDLDVVLTTELPPEGFEAHPIATQDVGLHGHPDRLNYTTLEALLAGEPLIVPTDRAIRARFDGLLGRLGVTPRILADVDDMAMVRLLARENVGVAVAPAVVLADEIASGRLATAPFTLDIAEPFYAITVPRNFPHPGLAKLLGKG